MLENPKFQAAIEKAYNLARDQAVGFAVADDGSTVSELIRGENKVETTPQEVVAYLHLRGAEALKRGLGMVVVTHLLDPAPGSTVYKALPPTEHEQEDMERLRLLYGTRILGVMACHYKSHAVALQLYPWPEVTQHHQAAGAQAAGQMLLEAAPLPLIYQMDNRTWRGDIDRALASIPE